MRPVFFAATALAFSLTTACAQEPASVDTSDRAAIEEIVREYLISNPEVVEDALIELQRRREEAEAQQSRKAVADNNDALIADKRDFTIGPDDAAVTVVEFFDYRCPPCRRSVGWVNTLPERFDNDVRVVFKEFPVLSPQSRVASLAALAAGRQGKYMDMHLALMADPSEFTDADIDRIAAEAGVDVARMRSDMELPELEQQIADNYALATRIGADATPTFIIGDDLSSGLNPPKLENLIARGIAGAD